MILQKLIKRILLVITLVCFLTSCNNNSTHDRIQVYINSIKVINTHEHQRMPPEYEGKPYNFYTLLAHSYLRSDLISAGAPVVSIELINSGKLDDLWDKYGKYLEFSRNTSYYSHFLNGFKTLYDYKESSFTKEGIRILSEQIRKNYENQENWYKKAFDKSGFEIMFVDQYWNPLNTKLDSRYFTLVFNINDLVYSASQKPNSIASTNQLSGLHKYARNNGFSIVTLDNYLEFAEYLVNKFIDNKAICLKNSMAYGRSLDYDYVSYERANNLFSKNSNELNQNEKKELQDFMFHWIIKKSIEIDLPIQIHTGYLAGNGSNLSNGRPTKLNSLFLRYRDAKFILFHGGFPWTGEFNALGKMYPNVYLDLVWLPQISRETAIDTFEKMLDCVPYNKIFWGGDCHSIEESAGSVEFGRDVVSKVLTSRVKQGLMTEDLAFEIARGIFRDNATRVFKLENKF